MTSVAAARTDAAPVPRPGTGPRGRRSSQPATLRSYGHFVRRHRNLITALALLGASIGGVLVANSPAEYVAKAKVAVTAQPTGADIDTDRPRLVSLDSDAQILSSGEVLSRAAQNAAFPGGGDALRESLDVSALPNSRVLIVRVTDADRATALRACGAIIDEFLRTRAETESERGRSESAALTTQIDDVLSRLADLQSAASEDEPDEAAPVRPDALDPATNLLERLAVLENELRLVSSSGTASPGTVVLPPTAPAAGGRPMAGATIASGLLIGALLGVAAAGLRGNRLGDTGLARHLHLTQAHLPHPHLPHLHAQPGSRRSQPGADL